MSFVEYAETNDFPIENLPFGVFSTAANVSCTSLLFCIAFIISNLGGGVTWCITSIARVHCTLTRTPCSGHRHCASECRYTATGM